MINETYCRKTRAMSILELLIVVGLIAVMATLAIPAFVSIAQGSGMKRGIIGVSDALEVARTEAMATSTWVLVGFSPDLTSTPPRLTIVRVSTRDGTANSSADNLQTLAKPTKIENVTLLKQKTEWASNATLLGSSDFGFVAQVDGRSMTFADTIIAFSPQGEAMLRTNSLASWIEIPIRELRGTTPITNKTASIRVSGPSGQVVVSY